MRINSVFFDTGMNCLEFGEALDEYAARNALHEAVDPQGHHATNYESSC